MCETIVRGQFLSEKDTTFSLARQDRSPLRGILFLAVQASFFHCSVREEMEATQAREGKRWVLEKEKSKCYFDKSVEPALRVDEGDIIRLETSDEAYYRLSQGESAGVSFALR